MLFVWGFSANGNCLLIEQEKTMMNQKFSVTNLLNTYVITLLTPYAYFKAGLLKTAYKRIIIIIIISLPDQRLFLGLHSAALTTFRRLQNMRKILDDR